MSTLEIPEVQPTTEPCTVVLPSTEGDDTLREMLERVHDGGWTRGKFYSKATETRCTLGLLRHVSDGR